MTVTGYSSNHFAIAAPTRAKQFNIELPGTLFGAMAGSLSSSLQGCFFLTVIQ